jgi:hypothetical protein
MNGRCRGSPAEAPRRNSTPFRAHGSPHPDPPRTRARGAIPTLTPALRQITSPEALDPDAADRIASPSAGSGPIWVRTRDRGPGGFPPWGVMGPKSPQGDPDRPQSGHCTAASMA